MSYEDAPRELPLKIGTSDDGRPSIQLAGIELAMMLSGEDGIAIRYEQWGWRSMPVVTLTFGPGALDLDFEIDLLETLLAEKKAAASDV